MGGFSLGDQFSLGVEGDFGSDKNFQVGDVRWHNPTACLVMLIEKRLTGLGLPGWLVEDVFGGGRAVTDERKLGKVTYTAMEVLAWASK